MPEWRGHVEQRLAGLDLSSDRRAAIVDEVSEHLDDRYAELLAAGVPEPDAVRLVLEEIDNLDEFHWRAHRGSDRGAAPPRVETGITRLELGTALRRAMRQFQRERLYAFAFAATLALAVAASTASFALLKRAFLDPLPYANGEQLFSVLTAVEGQTSPVSFHVLEDLRASASPFDHFAAIRPANLTYRGHETSEPVVSNAVTAEYFTTLGIAPALGSVWSDQSPPSVIISWSFWQRVFRGGTDVVGQSISLDGVTRTIAGVLPERFVPPYWPNAEAWIPLDVSALSADPRARRQLTVIARAPKAHIDEIDAYLRVFSAALQNSSPDLHGRQSWVGIPLRNELVGPVRPALVAIGAAAALLLVIVCANIAGLSAARAISSRHESAVRTALGATSGRLLQERLVDALVIAAAGSVAGLAMAYGVVKVVAQYQQQFLPRIEPVSLDGAIALVGLFAGLVIGAAAAVRPQGAWGDSDLASSLRGARGSAGARSSTAMRSTLVVLQVASAIVLIVGAGLLARTVRHLATTSLGFSTEQLTLLQVNLPGPRYRTAAQQIQFEEDVLERLRGIAGVTAATASVGYPIIGGMGASLTTFGSVPEAPPVEIAYLSVSPDFFPVLGIPLKTGRNFAEADRAGTPNVLVINETLATMLWPQGTALGQRIFVGAGRPNAERDWSTIIGVVADVRQHGPTEPVRPTAYGSTRQYSWPRRHFSVRTETRGASLTPDLRGALRAIDPSIAVGAIRSVDSYVAERTARHSLAMMVLSFFGAVSLVLCGFGLYAVIALTSQLRRREYAIRMALGARRERVQGMVVRQAMLLAGWGIAGGVLAAGFGTRALQGILHGVEPMDLATFAGASVVVLLVAGGSAWLPARRAGRVNPIEALNPD